MEQPHTSAEQAVAHLYQEQYQPILRYLKHITGNPEVAEDLAQETFLKALRHWHQLATPDGAAAWLFRIARHTAYDCFRRQRRSRAVPLSELHTETLAARRTELVVEDREPIDTALGQLAEPYRLALLLHTYAGYSIETIAEVLGWKVGTVKSRLSRARVQFRRHYVA